MFEPKVLHLQRLICVQSLIFCHIILNSDPRNEMEVVAGSLSLDWHEPTEQSLAVEEAIKHENYRETPTAVYNDIGDQCSSTLTQNAKFIVVM